MVLVYSVLKFGRITKVNDLVNSITILCFVAVGHLAYNNKEQPNCCIILYQHIVCGIEI